jgi:hypothetical protein
VVGETVWRTVMDGRPPRRHGWGGAATRASRRPPIVRGHRQHVGRCQRGTMSDSDGWAQIVVVIGLACLANRCARIDSAVPRKAIVTAECRSCRELQRESPGLIHRRIVTTSTLLNPGVSRGRRRVRRRRDGYDGPPLPRCRHILRSTEGGNAIRCSRRRDDWSTSRARPCR